LEPNSTPTVASPIALKVKFRNWFRRQDFPVPDKEIREGG